MLYFHGINDYTTVEGIAITDLQLSACLHSLCLHVSMSISFNELGINYY